MSFGESMFLAGFIRKTVKEDQIIKLNHDYPPRNQLQKVPETWEDTTPKQEPRR
jgi:hypothetical protein